MVQPIDKHYRPKADRQRLYTLINEAWEAHSKVQFPEWEQESTGLMLASLLEQRFPPADMIVLEKYGQAKAPPEANVNIWNPTSERWDVYANVKLPRPVLCPQGRAHFYVGGLNEGNSDRDNHLSAEFEPFFNKIREAREAYNAEMRYTPDRINGSYPTWREIADRLPIAGAHIRREIEACSPK